ncbi:MAG: glycosyltransferase [Patescibacteria group bacterium]
MNQPRISLTCVVLNEAKYIETTIKSIQAQSYPDWELIIMDGASTDGTQDIVSRLAAKDPRIKLTSEPDEGPWDATEKAVAKTTGEFIMIVAGQDGFLDNDWFARCINIFDQDPTVSLVWASTREMADDGRLLSDDHVTYSHLTNSEKTKDVVRHIIAKVWLVARDLVMGSSVRRKVLLRKFFSRTAVFKLNFFFRRTFPQGQAPQKEEWFKYWLNTGIPFSEQPMCVAKEVYLDCVAKYSKGSRVIMDHIMDFHYNFNAKGYLSHYVPTLAGWGRNHPGNSGDRIPEELQRTTELYLQRIMKLRKKYLTDHEEMIFIDRHKKEVSRRSF